MVAVGPDGDAGAIGAETFVPIQPGTDAALALAMCKVIIDEGLADVGFVRSQTCLLYTSDAADERSSVDLGGRRIIKKTRYTIVQECTTRNNKRNRNNLT